MRKAGRWTLCCAMAMLALAAGAANAGIIYDNGTPDDQWGYISDFDPDPILRAADDFTLSEAATIRDVHWWGYYGYHGALPDTDSFTIEIYGMVGGAPAAGPPDHSIVVGDVGRTATGGGLPGSGPSVYKYDVGGLSIPLAAGTYALCIINDTTSADEVDWEWARRTQSAGTMWTNVAGEPWVVGTSGTAFYVTDDVPEPAGLGLIGLAALTLKRRRNS